jgi:hypothetical protein
MLTEEQAEIAVKLACGEVHSEKVMAAVPTLLGAVVGNLKVGGMSYLEILRILAAIVSIIREYGPQIAATVGDLVEQAKQLADKVRELLGK